MMSRAFRSAVAILSTLLLSALPGYAGPVAIRDVIQVLGSLQKTPELRLRSVSQNIALVEGEGLTTSVLDAGDPTLLSAVVMDVELQGVQVIDQGQVEGTICDCGEITVPAGGFPKWPLLFLAAIPFFFSHGCDDCEIEIPHGTPPGTPSSSSPIPEPASLLLFGSGLAAVGAGLRRRYARAKLAAQIQNREEA